MIDRLVKAPRGEAEHFMACPNCGAILDMRDLGQALEHETRLHIEQGWRKKRAAIATALSAKSGWAWR